MSSNSNALNMAVGSAVTGSVLTCGAGMGGGSQTPARGAFGIGAPVYTSPSNNFSIGVGAASSYGRNMNSSPAFSAGFKFRF
jgi:hypothetical protein